MGVVHVRYVGGGQGGEKQEGGFTKDHYSLCDLFYEKRYVEYFRESVVLAFVVCSVRCLFWFCLADGCFLIDVVAGVGRETEEPRILETSRTFPVCDDSCGNMGIG